MGVKGLQTFIDQHCPSVKQNVSIRQMADDHRQRYNVKPELVVDGMAVIHHLYSGELEWFYGGQWIQYRERLKKFVSRFDECGVKLVFFFDGTVITTKRREWAERRVQRCHEMADMFVNLKETNQIPADFKMPTSMGQITSLALKMLCSSADVYATLEDGDLEIASYAKQHIESFAILSNDTDFIIYDSKPYLSVSYLDDSTLETVLYDRNHLSQFLNLTQSQLLLLSCLLGNDFVSRDWLRRFHSGLRKRNRLPLPILAAEQIRSSRWEGNFCDHNELCHISNEVFGNNGGVEALRHGISMYVNLEYPRSPLTPAQWRHVNCINASLVYNVLSDRVYGSSELMEDPTDETLPPAALVYRPMRQRIYTILLGGGNRNPEDIVVEEWCAYSGNDLQYPDYIKGLPLMMAGEVPSRDRLWKDPPLSEEDRYIKMQCFLACIGSALTVDHEDVLLLEGRYIIFCCIINYLLMCEDTPLLKIHEVVAFLAHAVSLRYKTADQIQALEVPFVQPRALHLSSLFMRGVSSLIFALGACGYPLPLEDAMPWNFFDGKIFQAKYHQTLRNVEIPELCEYQESSIELYERLFAVITHGTAYQRKDIP